MFNLRRYLAANLRKNKRKSKRWRKLRLTSRQAIKDDKANVT